MTTYNFFTTPVKIDKDFQKEDLTRLMHMINKRYDETCCNVHYYMGGDDKLRGSVAGQVRDINSTAGPDLLMREMVSACLEYHWFNANQPTDNSINSI